MRGKPRIAGSRIQVRHIVLEYLLMGRNVDEICKSHPHVTRSQIHAALSYYYDHHQEFEGNIKDDKEFAKSMAAKQR